MGFLESQKVHSCGIQDRDGAKLVFKRLKPNPRLEVIWADSAYGGKLVIWVKEHLHCRLEIVKRSDKTQGFQVQPHRWIVERTFGWFGDYRLLDKEHETSTESSEGDIFLLMIRIMLRRMAP